MNGFMNLTPFVQGCILMYITVLLYGQLYILITFIQQKRKFCLTILQLMITLYIAGMFWFLNEMVYRKPLSSLARMIYCMPVGICMSLLTFITLIMVDRGIRWRRHHITPSSIKEAFDQLPMGLCYYWESGLVKFSNIKMESLCNVLMHTNLMNGKEFYRYLLEGTDERCLQKGEAPIYRFDDRIYSFKRNMLELDGNVLYEIMANDITEEYRLHKELEEKNLLAEGLNQRLKQMSEKITEITIEKEILSSKIHIHDDWGKALLLTKQYLMQPDSQDSEDVYSLWGNCINSTKEQGKEYHQDTYEEVYHYADLLGIRIIADGKLPEHDNALVSLTLQTCISNIEKHTTGDILFVSVWEDEIFTHLVIKDNGNNRNPVVEKGGLANLRKRIEENGGSMSVTDKPQFQLCVNIRKDDTDGL